MAVLVLYMWGDRKLLYDFLVAMMSLVAIIVHAVKTLLHVGISIALNPSA